MILLVICFREQRLVLFIMLRQSFHQAVRSKLNTPSAHGTEMECEKKNTCDRPKNSQHKACTYIDRFFVALDGHRPLANRCTRESEDTLAAADGCGLFRIPSTQVALRFGFCQFHGSTLWVGDFGFWMKPQ